MQSLTTQTQLDELIENQVSCRIYKYNANGCRLSVLTQPFVLDAEKKHGLAVWQIDVQTHRPLAIVVADLWGVQHESPQLLVVKDGNVIAHTSHSHITPEWIEQHLQKK